MQKTLIDTGTPFVRQVELLIEKCGLDVDLFTVGVAAAPEVDGPANYGVLILPIDDEIAEGRLKDICAAIERLGSRGRVFGVFSTEAAQRFDSDLHQVLDEVVVIDAFAAEGRLKRFVERHYDSLKSEAIKTFSDSASDGLWIWNIAGGSVEWSDRTYQMLGYEPASAPMTFEEYVDLIHPDDRETTQQHIEEHLNHHVRYRDIPMRLRTAIGSYRHLIAAGQAIRGPDGLPILMVGAVTDVTGELNAEQAAKEAKEQYAVLFHAMNDAVVIADPMTGKIVEANERAAMLWSIPRGDLIGQPQTILHPPDLQDDEEGREAFRRHIRQLQNGDTSTITMPILRSDGARIETEISSAMVEIAGQTRILGLFRDISERLAAQASLRERDAQIQMSSRLAAMGSLAAGVGHEINNPLAYVMGNLTYIKDSIAELEGLDSDVMSALDDAIEGSGRVRDIVKDLKALTRGDGTETTCDPAEVVTIAARMAEQEIRHRAKFDISLEECGLAVISGSRLSQVAVNLLTNAAHSFAEDDLDRNLVQVRLSSTPTTVVLEVTDNGGGIADEMVDRVFDPFFTTKDEVLGTGLGLSISRRLVESVGGTIKISTQVGTGTTVTAELPAAGIVSPFDNLGSPESAVSGSPSPRLLIVDDDPLVANAMKRVLSSEYEVEACTDATEALRRLDNDVNDFDLVVCDLMMPSTTGVQLHEQLLGIRPAIAERMLFVTGGAVTQSAMDFERTMVAENRLLHKPVDMGQLRTAIGELLSAEAA